MSQSNPEVGKHLEVVEKERTMANLIWRGLQVGRLVAVKVIEEILGRRADEPTEASRCERCGASMESKGRNRRQLVTMLGIVRWQDR
ncbi:MAG: hypothetical protein AAF702_16715 [Chloroflexota bacterium]